MRLNTGNQVRYELNKTTNKLTRDNNINKRFKEKMKNLSIDIKSNKKSLKSSSLKYAKKESKSMDNPSLLEFNYDNIYNIINKENNKEIKYIDENLNSKINNNNNIKDNVDDLKNGMHITKKPKLGVISNYIFGENTMLLDGVSFFQTKQAEFLNVQLKLNSFFQFLFVLLSIISGFVFYELEYKYSSIYNEDNYDDKEYKYYTAEWVCFISTIGFFLTLFFEYLLDCELDSYLKRLPKRIWVLSLDKISYLITNMAIFACHPNPFFHNKKFELYNLKFEYNQVLTWNSVFFSLLLLRFWFFFKLLVDFSEYSSARSKRVCRMNNFTVDFYFCIKSLMKSTPYSVYSILLILCITFCSCNLRIYERGLDNVSGFDYSNIWNCIWNVVIIMTTVGFGDIYPSSIPGRVIGILGSFMGVFLVSMLVVTITNVLMLSDYEQNVFLIVEKLHLEKDYFLTSQELITKYFKLVKLYKQEQKKSTNADMTMLKKRKYDYLKNYYRFQKKSTEIQSTFPPYSIYDAINENLNNIEEEFSEMNKKQEGLSQNVIDILDKLQIK